MTWSPSFRDYTGVEVLLLYVLVGISVLALGWWLLRVVKTYRTGGKRSAILQPSSLVVLFLALAWLYVSFERTSGVLPTGDAHYLEGCLCWPYNVTVHSIDEVKMDQAFHRYPLDSYFPEGEDFGRTRWTNYNEIDTALRYGMDSTLKYCVGNNDLYNSLLNGDPIYFAGTYRPKIVSSGSRKRHYERILFLDVTKGRLHIFKDINKVF
jgi:hypothetical protein